MSDAARASLLVTLSLLGAGLAWLMALAPTAGAGEGGAPAPEPPPAPPALVELPPLSAFHETVERPLFVKGRRPAGASAAGAPGRASPPPPSAPRLSVAGIAIAGQRRAALVVMEGAAKPVSLAEGGDIAGWTVTAIAEDRIRLEKGAEAFELALRGFKR